MPRSATEFNRIWLECFHLAEQYFYKYGDLLIPDDYVYQGVRLGEWIGMQRTNYKKRTNPLFTQERIDHLNGIGMIWDVYSYRWEKSYQLAKTYYALYGHLRVSKDYGKYITLGRWISTQRKQYRAGKLCANYIQKLEQIGMVWDASIDSSSLWESWFQKATAYYRRYGHLNPQRGKLRTWILTQRSAKKERRGHLTSEQIQRLEEIGMIWDVFDARWNVMYQHAQEYYRIHQMLNVPCNYITDTGARLGQWIARQRQNYKNFMTGKRGGGKGTITLERIALLNELGMIWDGMECISRTSFPEKSIAFYLGKRFSDVQKLSFRQGMRIELDLYIPSIQTAIEYDGFPWHCEKQEADERKGTICKAHGIHLIRLRESRLPQVSICDQVIEVEGTDDIALEAAICKLFQLLSVSCPNLNISRDRPAILKTYRNYTARAWDRVYQLVHQYYDKHGFLPHSSNLAQVGEVNLPGWLNIQRQAYRNNELTKEQIEKLESLGIQWSPNEKRWNHMYQLAVLYRRIYGNLQIPYNYINEQGDKVGVWLSQQRKLYKKQTLSAERIYLLEQLGMEWDPVRKSQEEYWNAVTIYYQHKKNLDIPATYITKDNLRLGQWLSKQRICYRAGTLSEKNIQRL